MTVGRKGARSLLRKWRENSFKRVGMSTDSSEVKRVDAVAPGS
jgi:hypothetical protein